MRDSCALFPSYRTATGFVSFFRVNFLFAYHPRRLFRPSLSGFVPALIAWRSFDPGAVSGCSYNSGEPVEWRSLRLAVALV